MESSERGRVGERLKAFRQRAGFSQRAFGPMANVSHATISKWENGSRPIDADDLPKLAALLGCSPADFFDDVARPRSQAERAAQMVTDFDQAELRSRLARLQRVRREIDALIQEEESA